MHVRQVIEAIESIAPPQHAAEWDNVGLLIGTPGADASPLLLTIDLTEAVLQEAVDAAARMVIAYHPPIFEPLLRLTDATAPQRVALSAARHGIAVYSPHTALDAAPGGINDWLAQGVGPGDVRALRPAATLPRTEQCKLVTFCPPEAVDRLRQALAAAGAGRIGGYEQCSFEIPGTGTFFGGPTTSPRAGARGKLERVAEIRLEMVCPREALALAVTTVREFHPYEEPPIEIHPLEPRPLRGTGEGRRVVLDANADLPQLVERLKKHLGVQQLRVADAPGAPRRYGVIGLCAGSGGALAPEAAAQGCEAYLTGEMRHHDVLAAQAAGCTVLLAGHTNTERGYLPVLRQRLLGLLACAHITISRTDADPLRVM